MRRADGSTPWAGEAHPGPMEWLGPGLLPSHRAHKLAPQLRASWGHSHQVGGCQTGDGRTWGQASEWSPAGF